MHAVQQQSPHLKYSSAIPEETNSKGHVRYVGAAAQEQGGVEASSAILRVLLPDADSFYSVVLLK